MIIKFFITINYILFPAGLLSPQSSKTPPPSPAEFKDTQQQNEPKECQLESVTEKEQLKGK